MVSDFFAFALLWTRFKNRSEVALSNVEQVRQTRVIAVVRGASAKDALEVCHTLIEGGVKGIEVTFTTPDALSVIEKLAEHFGNRILLGAGTVLKPQQAQDAARAGATFLVSPGSPAKLVEAMKNTGLLTIPGAVTPTEIMLALEAGADIIKLFPASLGGAAYAKALLGPFPELKFIPTGGISLENGEDWFVLGALALGMGGSLAPGAVQNAEHRARLLSLAQQVSQKFAHTEVI